MLASRLEDMLMVAEPSWRGNKVDDKGIKETQEATPSLAKSRATTKTKE